MRIGFSQENLNNLRTPGGIVSIVVTSVILALGVFCVVAGIGRIVCQQTFAWGINTSGCEIWGFPPASDSPDIVAENLFPFITAGLFATGFLLVTSVIPLSRHRRIALLIFATLFLGAGLIWFVLPENSLGHQPAVSALVFAGLAVSLVRAVQLQRQNNNAHKQLIVLTGQPAQTLYEALAEVQTRLSQLDRTQSLAHTQLRETAAQDERNRLARDLHDTIKQQLFSINMAAATAQSLSESDPLAARDLLQQVRDLSQQAQVEMRAMLTQLRAQPLATVGLGTSPARPTGGIALS